MLLHNFLTFLTVPPEYDYYVNVLPWYSRFMCVALLFIYTYMRKLKKQNAELNRRVKEQEAELASLRQQKPGTGEETE